MKAATFIFINPLAARPKQEAAIVVEGAAKHYRLGAATVAALTDIHLAIQRGEFLAIAGPSGSGKSTLLNLIGCIEKPDAGRIWIDGTDVAGLSADRLANIRLEKIGFIFQNFNLFPVLTAIENVEYPLTLQTMSRTERRDRAAKALETVGLARHHRHKPLELSGGQRQRVAIARALVAGPEIVLADEPTANLDHKTGVEILDLMKTISEERRTTFVFSTHDPKVIAKASRVVNLVDGRFEELP